MENIPHQPHNFSTQEGGNIPAAALLKPTWAVLLGVMYIPSVLTLSLFTVNSGIAALVGGLMGFKSEGEMPAFFICLITMIMVMDTFPIAFGKKYTTAFSQKEKKTMLIPIPMIILSFVSYFFTGLL